MWFAFAAAIDSDKRLFPLVVVYDVAEISGEWSWTISRGDDDDEWNYTSDGSMSDSAPGEFMGRSLCAVVAKVRIEYQSMLFLGYK